MYIQQTEFTNSSSSVSWKELEALKELYDYTNGSNWIWRNETLAGKIWDFTASSFDPCVEGWQALRCSCYTSSQRIYHPFEYAYYSYHYDYYFSNTTNCRIVELFLINYGLYGQLPASIFNYLPWLTHLHLARNTLFGPLPLDDNSTNATSLELLDVSHNYFSGSFPSYISKLSNLQYLSVKNNFFSRSICTELASLLMLGHLDLSYNAFTSSLMTEIGYMDALSYFSVRKNKLTGSYKLWTNA